jgi:hypothetical protein
MLLQTFIIYLESRDIVHIKAYNIQDAVQRASVNPRVVRSVFKTTQ